MSFFVVDVESDGPIPPKYSMVSFAAVKVEDPIVTSFSVRIVPISDLWVPEALAVSGLSREECFKGQQPSVAMAAFRQWLLTVNKSGRPIFMSDNVAYDWQWMNYYFHYYLGENPFGWSGRRIGDLYAGLTKNMYAKWKFLRKTKHTHDPLDDARGNVEVLLEMKKMGLKISLD